MVRSAFPWHFLSGCGMHHLHKAIVVCRDGSISQISVSKSVEKAFHLVFLNLKRRRKRVGVGATAALI